MRLRKEKHSVANDTHIKELKLGVNNWNRWRRRHFAESLDFSGADLSGLNLSGANLIGADFSKANLSLTDLSGAFLTCANLNQAYLSEAKLCKVNLSKADLTKADLSFADLTGATLIEANLNRATLIEASLVATNLSFADLNRANLTKADLQKANLTKSILIEATLNQTNLRGCNLNQAIASEASLREANLMEARLSKADFSFATLVEANCRRANFSKAILVEANLRGANLRETNLRKGNFGRANLGSADIIEADLSEANFMAADLIRANLSKSICLSTNLREAQLNSANLNRATLTMANLTEADLSEGDLTKTDLRQANLAQADLTRSKIAATNFSGANLTGICLEDAQLSSTTKLEGVDCHYIYLKRNNQDRRPSVGEFVTGEFAQLFHSALETINLTLHAGVNWSAFAHSINQLNRLHKAAQLGIQSIENKGDGIILLKLSTSPGTDTVQIHRDFMRIYKETQQQFESHRQLNVRDTLLGHGEVSGGHPRESINQLFELLSPSRSKEADQGSAIVGQTAATPPRTVTDIASLLRLMLTNLARRYPDATETQRMLVTALEIQQRAKRDIAFKEKLAEAVQSGSLVIDQVLRSNPFLPITLETVQEWLSAVVDVDFVAATVVDEPQRGGQNANANLYSVQES
jgi:uncharacterized protein YjbI with pentapeptide repeats